jgi:hypothetical protein
MYNDLRDGIQLRKAWIQRRVTAAGATSQGTKVTFAPHDTWQPIDPTMPSRCAGLLSSPGCRDRPIDRGAALAQAG